MVNKEQYQKFDKNLENFTPAQLRIVAHYSLMRLASLLGAIDVLDERATKGINPETNAYIGNPVGIMGCDLRRFLAEVQAHDTKLEKEFEQSIRAYCTAHNIMVDLFTPKPKGGK